MRLLKFWPTESDCLECIKPEAENPSDAVFLAVHQKMRFVRKSFATDQAEKKSQQQLLKEFLRDEPSGRVILPILGESGIGKSHLVRWLDVQLRQRDDCELRHVIRIPKSSSLKSVLGRILDGLEGKRYEEIRTQLKAAREQMDDIGAKQRIRAELLTAIERNYASAVQRKQELKKNAGGKPTQKDRQWAAHGDPRALPALLNDPATQILFTRGTSERPGIISELARHITKDTAEEDAPRRQFEQADFLIPDELVNDVKDAGVIAGTYLEKLQRATSSKVLDEAVDLLNGVVDDAIAPLATPADTSLAELFYDVRRQLLVDGRELVLLVEDFAVLAGVQKALLDAIIREGETGGKKEACTIRTALAVTDGYFGNLDTVKTRAIHGWWIAAGENEAEEAVTNQIGNFVAAYVNAARLGAERLEEHYANESNIGESVPNAMDVLAPEPEELSLLASFGQSVDGFSLFPFNLQAICAIADWRVRDQQGRLRFHPRSVINEIILPLVKDSRMNYENSRFPSENFLGFSKNRISTDLGTEIARRENDPIRRDQYLYLLHFWAGQPQTLSEVRLPTGVYEAFGLTVLDGSKASNVPEPLVSVTSSDTGGQQERRDASGVTSKGERVPLPIRTFVEKLDAWKGGGVLGQADALRIRGWINSHLLYSINWEAELLRPIKPTTTSFAKSIHLPRSRGNPPNIEKAFVVVARDEAFEQDKIANSVYLAIRAMLRFDHYKGWDYEQADADYNALANFIDAHIYDATKWVRGRYKHVEGSPVATLIQCLLWQSRLLDVDSAHPSGDGSHVAGLFAETRSLVNRDDDQEWYEFIDELSSARGLLQEELLDRVGAFQGTGGKPHAIDASQILGVIQDFRKTWELSEKFPEVSASVSDKLKIIEKHTKFLSRYGNSRVEAKRKRIAVQSKKIVSELGTAFDKIALINDLEEVCMLSEQHGLKGEVSVGEIRKLLERFKHARVKEVSAQVESIVSGGDFGNQLTAIAKLDAETHALLVSFADTCSRFLKERATKARGQISDWTTKVVNNKKAEVDGYLQELENAVIPYAKVDE